MIKGTQTTTTSTIILFNFGLHSKIKVLRGGYRNK